MRPHRLLALTILLSLAAATLPAGHGDGLCLDASHPHDRPAGDLYGERHRHTAAHLYLVLWRRRHGDRRGGLTCLCRTRRLYRDAGSDQRCGWGAIADTVTVEPVPLVWDLYLPLVFKGEPAPRAR
jgi:hypothetical protein